MTLVEKMLVELDAIEQDTDEMQIKLHLQIRYIDPTFCYVKSALILNQDISNE